MTENGGEDRSDNRGAIAIAIVAIVMIVPISAIFSGAAWIPYLLGLLMVGVGGTFAARYLMGYRHELRMQELEMQERLLREERAQLDVADRLLAADDEAVRRQIIEGDTQ